MTTATKIFVDIAFQVRQSSPRDQQLKEDDMSQNSKHTSGPWYPHRNTAGSWEVKTFRDDCENPQQDVGYQYGATICLGIGDHTETRTSGNEEANARLIAMAPDLLGELESLVAQALDACGAVSEYCSMPEPSLREKLPVAVVRLKNRIDKARAVLAKAEAAA